MLGSGVGEGVRDDLTFELSFGNGRVSDEGLEEGKGCSRQKGQPEQRLAGGVVAENLA